MGQDSIYQLACINFTLFLALEKSDHSTCSSGELSWKKISQIFFGQWLEKDMLVITLQGTSSRAYTLCFNLLALGLWIVLALENEWEIAIFCYNSWHQLTTHQLSLLKIVLLLLYKSTRFSFHDPCILTLETSPSCHPRFLWMKASWWPFHSFCPLLWWPTTYCLNQDVESESWHYH